MKSLVIHTRFKSSDKKYLCEYTDSSINIQDSDENQENDGIDYEDVDYYTAEGNYYYYLEVEEG